MAKPTKTSLPRLSAKPPGILGFADGGKVETADELMARMTSKYGVPSAGPAPQQPTTVAQQPATPKPAPTQPASTVQGIMGILRGRKEAIDKAAGFANGGKISGPGTPTSDSIDAKVHETGEPIKVSTEERIVSKAQGQFLESVAKNAGYGSLDQMFNDAGLPVGPVVKAGKRAAADGMAPDTDPDTDGRRQYSANAGDAFSNRGSSSGNQRVDTAIAAPPTLGGAPLARAEPAGTLSNPSAAGLTIDPFGPKPEKLGSGLSGIDPSIAFRQQQQPVKPGRDASGIITADSAQSAADADMQRSGGIAGGIDMAGVNDILARENKARGEMIDLSIAANGGNGVAILGGGGPTEEDRANAEKTQRWNNENLLAKTSGKARAAAIGQIISGQNQQAAEAIRQEGIARGQDLSHGARMAQQGLTARGQDLGLQRTQERNDVITRGQDVRAGSASDRIASNESIAAARVTARSGPTLSQQRANTEIDAARQTVAGLTTEEIRRKTAKTTNTGRENPDYDPQLERAASLANRRRVGDDPTFDQRLQPQQPAGNDGDAMTRFRSDKAMQGYKLGQPSDRGHEVLDSAGKVIGHWN